MTDKSTLKQKFISGALSVFRFGRVPIKDATNHRIDRYVWHVCEDLNTAYSKLKTEYERN